METSPAVSWSGMILAFWVLLAIYAWARFLQVFPGNVPMLAILALHIFPPLVFVLFHGSLFYGWRDILTFTVLFLVVGNIFENLGVLTGVPFGHYSFTDVMEQTDGEN